MTGRLERDRADIARRRALALPPRLRWVTLTAWGVDVAFLARTDLPTWTSVVLVVALAFASHQLLGSMKTADGFDREDANLSAAHPTPIAARICLAHGSTTATCTCPEEQP